MRAYLYPLLLVGLATTQTLALIPSAPAADLALRPAKRIVHHHRHWAVNAVRDYDGTPVIVVRRPIVVRGYDGSEVVSYRSDVYPARRSQPTRYMNGEPVLPSYPRGWPRQATYRYAVMTGQL